MGAKAIRTAGSTADRNASCLIVIEFARSYELVTQQTVRKHKPLVKQSIRVVKVYLLYRL